MIFITRMEGSIHISTTIIY